MRSNNEAGTLLKRYFPKLKIVARGSKIKVFGCGSAIASSSLMTELIQDKHIDDAYMISNKEIAKELKLPPVKLHCSMLAQDAIQSAIEDYVNKNNQDNILF